MYNHDGCGERLHAKSHVMKIVAQKYLQFFQRFFNGRLLMDGKVEAISYNDQQSPKQFRVKLTVGIDWDPRSPQILAGEWSKSYIRNLNTFF